jgi:type IV pilus assembly protein PilE
MRSSLAKGFTLIELLVVIAIIGVLSSIVLSSLNTARNKGSDSAIKSNLDQARSQAELFYDANSNHYVTSGGGGTATDVCSNLATGASTSGVAGIYASFLAAAQAGGVSGGNIFTSINSTADTQPFTKATCHSCYPGQSGTTCQTTNNDAWAAQVPLKSNSNFAWCVDSTGVSTTTVGGMGSGVAKCT